MQAKRIVLGGLMLGLALAAGMVGESLSAQAKLKVHKTQVMISAPDEDGSVLAEGATTIDSPEAGMGGEGPWQIALSVQVEPGTPGTVRAFSTSR